MQCLRRGDDEYVACDRASMFRLSLMVISGSLLSRRRLQMVFEGGLHLGAKVG